jgi:hypothetical protein
MSSLTYPVRVDASLEPHLNRGLWLVKWLLVLPHCILLAFLWPAFVVLSLVAFLAIVITGRYPRPIFELNVGVLRWTWRVAYYAFGVLGTDRYPPFTFADVPDYPAHLEVAHPERLSRGLVLVKWWLLAIPHYAVVAIFAGGGIYVANEATTSQQTPWVWGGGLIGVLVLVAAVVLLFTGRYPSSIFDLVLGLNRWVLRVAAYAALMTDDYPPFRLDMGPDDPGSLLAVSAPAPPGAGAAAPTLAPRQRGPDGLVQRPQQPPHPSGGWSVGRVVTMVLGCFVFLAAAGLLAGGVTLAVAQADGRDDAGFFMSAEEGLETSTHAIASANLETTVEAGAGRVPDQLLGDARLTVTSRGPGPVFVGIGPSREVRAYLADVGHTTVVDLRTDGDGPVYRDVPGGPPATGPGEAVDWAAQSSGTGPQDLVWSLEDGDWTVVVMNSDGSADVAVDVSAGAELPAIGWVTAILLSLGGCLLLLSVALVVGAARAAGKGSRA